MSLSEVEYLGTPEAIRERSEAVFEIGLYGDLDHFAIHLDRLPQVAHKVVEVTRSAYPDLEIPYHSRFRHFGAGGVDRLGLLDETLKDFSAEEKARTWLDLVVTSVLLDAGAGDRWRYLEEETGLSLERSEGLAVASFHLFLSGAFSEDRGNPCRATAEGLAAVDTESVERGFQASEKNPLVGAAARAELLRSLGRALAENAGLFGTPGRIGNLFDYLRRQSKKGRLEARTVFAAVRESLSSIWPERLTLEGVRLGDVWAHSKVGLVPFHKLSLWLTYSLIEPLELSGIAVEEPDALTGLAEYRNGGLFVDMGVLRPKEEAALEAVHTQGSELVVEWRALTIALLDRVAEAVRDELGMDRRALPLAKVLEGGTWRAGRVVARERRPGGSPPIHVESDGTVF